MSNSERDGKLISSESSQEEPRGWEPLDLNNLQDSVDIPIEESTEEVEIIEDETPIIKDIPSSKIEESTEQRKGRAQARITELVQRNKEKDYENESLRQEILRLNRQSSESLTQEVTHKKKSVEEKIHLIKKDLASSLVQGDVNAQVEAQDKLSKANVELLALESYKPEQTESTYTQSKPQYQKPAREQVLDKLPEAGRKWAEKNKWFVTNPMLTQQALGISAEVEAEGFTPEEPEYYEQIEDRLAELYPARFKKKPVEAEEVLEPEVKVTKPKPQSPVSASRPSPSQKPGTVRLTKDEVDRAKKWGIPLTEMAKQKKRLETAEKNGEKYTTIFGDS